MPLRTKLILSGVPDVHYRNTRGNRCVALLAATSRELETERREAQILRDTLRRIEEADHSAVSTKQERNPGKCSAKAQSLPVQQPLLRSCAYRTTLVSCGFLPEYLRAINYGSNHTKGDTKFCPQTLFGPSTCVLRTRPLYPQTQFLNQIIPTPSFHVNVVVFQVAGGDYAETETYPAKETAIEATEGCTNGGDQLNLALEMGRGSLLQAASATALGLLDHKLNVGAIGVVTALASFGVVLAAVATAGLLLFLPSSL